VASIADFFDPRDVGQPFVQSHVLLLNPKTRFGLSNPNPGKIDPVDDVRRLHSGGMEWAQYEGPIQQEIT
jgi:hypothetical protein